MGDTLIREFSQALAVLQKQHELLAEDFASSKKADEESKHMLSVQGEKIRQLEHWRDNFEKSMSETKENFLIRLIETFLTAKNVGYVVVTGLTVALLYAVIFQDILTKILEKL